MRRGNAPEYEIATNHKAQATVLDHKAQATVKNIAHINKWHLVYVFGKNNYAKVLSFRILVVYTCFRTQPELLIYLSVFPGVRAASDVPVSLAENTIPLVESQSEDNNCWHEPLPLQPNVEAHLSTASPQLPCSPCDDMTASAFPLSCSTPAVTSGLDWVVVLVAALATSDWPVQEQLLGLYLDPSVGHTS